MNRLKEIKAKSKPAIFSSFYALLYAPNARISQACTRRPPPPPAAACRLHEKQLFSFGSHIYVSSSVTSIM